MTDFVLYDRFIQKNFCHGSVLFLAAEVWVVASYYQCCLARQSTLTVDSLSPSSETVNKPSRGHFFLAVLFRVTHDGRSERGNTRSLVSQCLMAPWDGVAVYQEEKQCSLSCPSYLQSFQRS